MSALPAWFKEREDWQPENFCESDIRLYREALAIAWEALNDVAHGRPHDVVEDSPQYAIDAMRRIEDLGRETV